MRYLLVLLVLLSGCATRPAITPDIENLCIQYHDSHSDQIKQQLISSGHLSERDFSLIDSGKFKYQMSKLIVLCQNGKPLAVSTVSTGLVQMEMWEYAQQPKMKNYAVRGDEVLALTTKN